MVTLNEEEVEKIRDLFLEVLNKYTHGEITRVDDPSDDFAYGLYKEAKYYTDRLDVLLKGERS